jgi:hypothetical protein
VVYPEVLVFVLVRFEGNYWTQGAGIDNGVSYTIQAQHAAKVLVVCESATGQRLTYYYEVQATEGNVLVIGSVIYLPVNHYDVVSGDQITTIINPGKEVPKPKGPGPGATNK